MSTSCWKILLTAVALAVPVPAVAGDLGVTESQIDDRYVPKHRAYQSILDDRGARKVYLGPDLEITIEYLDGRVGSVEYSVPSVNDQSLTESQIEWFFAEHGGRDGYRETRTETYRVSLVNDANRTYAQIRVGMHKKPTRVIFWTQDFYNAYQRDARGKTFPGVDETASVSAAR
jgi:hypothetical protein